MFRNYLKIAVRNLMRSRIYSFINIAGLALGLASAMLIILYVKDEVSFDRFHKNVENIYRITYESEIADDVRKDGNTGYFQGPRFAQHVTGIVTFVRVQSATEDVKTGAEVEAQDLFYVDSSFFNVFTFPLLSGDPKTCLKDPHSVVISDKEAKKRFGTAAALGKMIMIKTDSVFIPYIVSAVAKNTPQNSSIRFDMLLPFIETEAQSADMEN